MTQFFNKYDIQSIAYRASRDPDLAPFGQAASRFVEIISEHNDEWEYWKAGHRAASKFLSLLNQRTRPRDPSSYDPLIPPTIAELRKAMAPMKALLAKHKLPPLMPV